MTPEQKDAQARNRFFVLGFLRLAGTLMVMFGIVIASGNWPPIPVALGYTFVMLGFLDIALLPRFLARRWRTPPEA